MILLVKGGIDTESAEQWHTIPTSCSTAQSLSANEVEIPSPAGEIQTVLGWDVAGVCLTVHNRSAQPLYITVSTGKETGNGKYYLNYVKIIFVSAHQICFLDEENLKLIIAGC